MIKMVIILSLLMQCSIAASEAQTQQSNKHSSIGVKNPSLLRVMKHDSSAVNKTDSTGSSLHENFLRSSGLAGPGTYITMRSDMFFGFEKYQPTHLEYMWEGAQIGAKVGLLMSAVGTTAGLWDEKDSWYLVGALTALGVLLRGSTMDEEPQWRVRLRWEPDRPGRGVEPFE
jgi:hypothetical protein